MPVTAADSAAARGHRRGRGAAARGAAPGAGRGRAGRGRHGRGCGAAACSWSGHCGPMSCSLTSGCRRPRRPKDCRRRGRSGGNGRAQPWSSCPSTSRPSSSSSCWPTTRGASDTSSKSESADVAQFTDAIRRVAGGESVIDPEVVSRLVARPRRDSPMETLTERERDVLALMAEGRSNQAIASQLWMSPRQSRPTSGASSPSWGWHRPLKTTGGYSRCWLTCAERARGRLNFDSSLTERILTKSLRLTRRDPLPGRPGRTARLQRARPRILCVLVKETPPKLAGLAVELARSAGDGQRGRVRLARPELDGALNCQAAAPTVHRDDAVRDRLLRVLFRDPGSSCRRPKSNPTIG